MPFRSYIRRAALAAALVSAACGGDGPTAPVRVASVRVTPDEASLRVGETLALEAEPLARGGAPIPDRPVTWRSADPDLATVTAAGVVEALAPGEVELFATADGVQGSTRLLVRPAIPAAVRITPEAPVIVVGQTLRLTATALDAHGEPQQAPVASWSTDDATTATISADGLVTALAEGPVTFTATVDGVQGALAVVIGPVPAAAITLDRATLDLIEGNAATVAATVRDAQGGVLEARPVTWSTGDPAVATVSASGAISAVAEGVTQVVATHGGVSAAVEVRVAPNFRAQLLWDTYDGTEAGPRLWRSAVTVEQGIALFAGTGTSQATPSPDGQYIAFTCVTSAIEGPAICVSTIDGTGVRVITGGDAANEDQPAWSPDGTRIAYRRWVDGATPGRFNPTDIWTTDRDGLTPRPVTSDTLVQHHPAWSPIPVDGAYRLVFVQERYDGTYVHANLVTVAQDGSDARDLTAPGARADDEPAWSPDGRHVVFTRRGGETLDDLWLVDVDTGAERMLFATPLGDEQRHPAWSPDGRFLAFTSQHETSPNGNYRFQVYTVRADGSGLTRRTTSDRHKEHVTWFRFDP